MKRPTRTTRQLVIACLALCVVVGATPKVSRAENAPSGSIEPADAGAENVPAEDERIRQARAHFERGVSHFDRGEWEAALLEFVHSRELVATRRNTKNTAICLRKVGRLVEALEMFETLVQDFADLSPAERALIDREIDDLEARVGMLEIVDAPFGAAITVDG